MRLMMAMAGARHGGAERFFERLATAFARRQVHLRVLMRREPGRAARLRANGIEPVELAFGGPLDLATRRAFARQVREFRPDIVLSFMSRAARLCPDPKRLGGFVHVGRLGGYYGLKYYRSCDHLIGNTPDLRAYLVRHGVAEDRAHYLPNFAEEGGAEPLDRAGLDTPDDAFLIAALGRLHPNKAFDVLLDAVANLPGAYLWLGGEGPLRAELEAQAQRLGIAGRVRFLGWRDDPRPVIAAADLVAVPSRHEPLGNVILEAWAQEKPVVAAASQGPPQLVDDAETGLLVKVDDAGALATAIGNLMQDAQRRDALARAGQAAFAARFSEAAVTSAYLELFHRLAPGDGAIRPGTIRPGTIQGERQ